MNRLGDILACVYYLLGIIIYCYDKKRRKLFWLSGLVIIGFFIFQKFYLIWFITKTFDLKVLSSYRFLVDWAFIWLVSYACFEIKPISALFYSTCGYCLQHLTQRIHYLFVVIILKLPFRSPLSIFLSIIIYLSVAFIFYYLFRKYFWKSKKQPKIVNPWQIILTTMSLAVSIVIESLNIKVVFAAEQWYIIGCFMTSIFFATLIIFLEYYMVSEKENRDENKILKEIIKKDHLRMEEERNIVEMLNIKCHDLKQFCIDGNVPQGYKSEIAKIVEDYNSLYRTGNSSLDTILTTKSILCKKRNILFTSIIDGDAISFMSDGDIYSLFGNILDNAIEAVEKIEEDKRYITITLKRHGNFILILSDNYYDGNIKKEGKNFISIKENKIKHGFGLKSVSRIVDKYNGELQIETENNLFKVSIMFRNNT